MLELQHYEKLHPDLDDGIELCEPRERRRRLLDILYASHQPVLSLALLSTVLAIALIVSIIRQPSTQCHPAPVGAVKEPPRTLEDCGTTVAEAKQKGCTFDLLTKYWLPANCPRTGTDDYLEVAGKYYKDYQGSEEWDDISAIAGTEEDVRETLWYTQERDHLAHCAFMLVRIAEASHDGVRLDAYSANVHHTRHCAEFLLNRSMDTTTADMINTRGNSYFGSC